MASVNNNKAVLEHVTHSMAETALDIYTHRCYSQLIAAGHLAVRTNDKMLSFTGQNAAKERKQTRERGRGGA